MAPAFLADARVDHNPRHVTFAYVPSADSPPPGSVDGRALGLVHDHAYWISGIRLANPKAPPPPMAEDLLPKCPCSPSYQHYLDRRTDLPQGLVDAFSFGFGRGDPASARTQGAGVGPLPYAEVGRIWGPAPAIAKRNRLALTLDNVARVRIDMRRAHLDVRRPILLDVASSHRARLDIGGKAVKVSPGHHLYRVAATGHRR
jgi:hypothetical protein